VLTEKGSQIILLLKNCKFSKNSLTKEIFTYIFILTFEQHMYNMIKNRATSLIAVSPHNGNRIVVLNSNDVLSLDIILGITIIISILGLVVLG
jgi:hypothetical protein